MRLGGRGFKPPTLFAQVAAVRHESTGAEAPPQRPADAGRKNIGPKGLPHRRDGLRAQVFVALRRSGAQAASGFSSSSAPSP
ncbi:DUF6053 domain-containing protein [Lysobacter enzymogenes]|uniref:DUF6053 domain-containing protein n=1 Tax=Lysobacter enzymogenes TaxID=69 RepID=UPI003D2F83B3